MVIELDTVRVRKARDAQDVSPEALLKHLLALIGEGEINPTKLVVAWFEECEDSLRRSAAFARVNRMEALALLEVTKSDTLSAWSTPGS